MPVSPNTLDSRNPNLVESVIVRQADSKSIEPFFSSQSSPIEAREHHVAPSRWRIPAQSSSPVSETPCAPVFPGFWFLRFGALPLRRGIDERQCGQFLPKTNCDGRRLTSNVESCPSIPAYTRYERERGTHVTSQVYRGGTSCGLIPWAFANWLSFNSNVG